MAHNFQLVSFREENQEFTENCRGVAVWATRVQNILFPLHRIVHHIERSFGSGISMFFDFWIGIIYLNMIYLIIQLGFLIIPWFFISPNFNFFADWKGIILGLIGYDSTVIGTSWFYYGGYKSIFPFYYLYPLSIIVYFIVSLIVISYQIIKRSQKLSNHGMDSICDSTTLN